MACAAEIPLATAKRQVASDWISLYRRLIK